MFCGLKSLFKDKKRWIPVAILALSWFILTLLPVLGIDSIIVRVLSYLTFAQGGITGGWFEIAGGLIGKGIFAFFVSSILVLPAFSSKPRLSRKAGASSKSGISQFLASIKESFKNIHLLPSLLVGCSLALFSYNFMTGDNSIQKSMLGITAIILSLKAMYSSNGFLRGFLTSLMNKFKNKKTAASPANSLKGTGTKINRIMAGITLGFTLAIPLSLVPFKFTSYIAGAVLVLVSLILAIVSKGKSEVTS